MYEEFYGLKEKPFSKTPDPRFLYQSSKHAEALARLQHAVEEQEMVLLTGEIGSGKTMLSRVVSVDGLLGVRLRAIKNSMVKLKHKDLIVMHSDGVSSTSEMSDFLTVNSFSSRLLAKKTVLKFGSDFDDASCIISKCISE